MDTRMSFYLAAVALTAAPLMAAPRQSFDVSSSRAPRASELRAEWPPSYSERGAPRLIHGADGTLYALRGNYDEAERWFRKALEINPKHAYSREMLQNLDRLRRGERLEGSIATP